MIVFPLHTILRLLGNESKVHLFPAILFQEMLPTRVKSHVARFREGSHIFGEWITWHVALVSAHSPRRGRYQTIANHLPGHGVLICQTDKQERLTPILKRVAAFFCQNGHVVKGVPSSLFL
jgi:hypothetical protein